MSFYAYKDIIEEGDLVIAFIGRYDAKPIHVTKGVILNTRYGNFKHDNMIGRRFGEQMEGAKGYGFIHLLHPTPELWTLSLPHRTQIVYTPDSSYILQRLKVGSGSRVIEAGTGSGSFTHSFARTVGSEGRVFSYEFHEPRYAEAKKEFDQHGLGVNTLITHRDVCEGGFEIDGIPQEFGSSVSADAIFLDLPSPWTAIPHLDEVITDDKRVGVCCFSPCIEQVEKTIEALQNNGWVNVQLVEVAGRRWEARKDMKRDVGDAIKRLKDIQSRRTKGIESRKHSALREAETNASESNDAGEDVDSGPASVEPESGDKRAHEDIIVDDNKVQNTGKGFNPFGKGERVREGDVNYSWRQVTRVESEIKTHTSYLTFAHKLPDRRI